MQYRNHIDDLLNEIGVVTDKKESLRIANKKWRTNNRERYLQSAKKSRDRYKQLNGDKLKDWYRKYNYKKQYGISYDEYIKLCQLQKHRCAICEKEDKLCVDHCHITNKIRGLVCRKCNSGMGMFNDDITTLEKAVKYLKETL